MKGNSMQDPIKNGEIRDINANFGSGNDVGVTYASSNATLLSVNAAGIATCLQDVTSITRVFIYAKDSFGTIIETFEIDVVPAALDLTVFNAVNASEPGVGAEAIALSLKISFLSTSDYVANWTGLVVSPPDGTHTYGSIQNTLYNTVNGAIIGTGNLGSYNGDISGASSGTATQSSSGAKYGIRAVWYNPGNFSDSVSGAEQTFFIPVTPPTVTGTRTDSTHAHFSWTAVAGAVSYKYNKNANTQAGWVDVPTGTLADVVYTSGSLATLYVQAVFADGTRGKPSNGGLIQL
jgi:hypothetical protein